MYVPCVASSVKRAWWCTHMYVLEGMYVCMYVCISMYVCVYYDVQYMYRYYIHVSPNTPVAPLTSSRCSSHQMPRDIFFCEEIPSLEAKIQTFICQKEQMGSWSWRRRFVRFLTQQPFLEWHKLSHMAGTKAFQSCGSAYRRLERHGWCKIAYFLTFHSKKSQKS